ncbi:MAG: type II toxin-antitoxin system VapC family toxin [Patescibacteria group bacterium]
MEGVIGIDSTVFMYLLAEDRRYLARVERLLSDVRDGKINGIFSCIGLIELLTGPKKRGQYDIASRYREIIGQFPHLSIRGLNERIVDLASTLRAEYGLRTPDAIHIATAIDGGAIAFVTNDRRLKKVKEIRIDLL